MTWIGLRAQSDRGLAIYLFNAVLHLLIYCHALPCPFLIQIPVRRTILRLQLETAFPVLWHFQSQNSHLKEMDWWGELRLLLFLLLACMR